MNSTSTTDGLYAAMRAATSVGAGASSACPTWIVYSKLASTAGPRLLPWESRTTRAVPRPVGVWGGAGVLWECTGAGRGPSGAPRRAPSQQSRPGPQDDIMLATGKPRQTERPKPPTQEQIRRQPGRKAWVPHQHGAW